MHSHYCHAFALTSDHQPHPWAKFCLLQRSIFWRIFFERRQLSRVRSLLHSSTSQLMSCTLSSTFFSTCSRREDSQLEYRTYFWDEEPSCGTRIIPLSATCRYLREQTRPRIFHEVSNWSKGAPRADAWSDALWPFIAEVTLRDRSVRHPNPIALSADVLAALPLMPWPNKVVLQLGIPVPSQFLLALASAPQLSSLEILQARLDGPLPPLAPLSFPSLQDLLMCVWKFTAVVSSRDVVAEIERENVAAILQSVCNGKFLPIHWPHLRKFAVTEHTPTPFLTELAVLYSADLSCTAGELRPPFTLGVPRGRLLTERSPRLTSVTLSNLKPDDPVLRQLPSTLEALHAVATWDLYIPESSAPRQTQESPLTPVTALTAIEHIAHLPQLVELTLTLDHFPTPDLIKIVSDAFPCLRFLELGNSKYPFGDELVEDVRDFALVESLSRLASLSCLCISLNFWRGVQLNQGRTRLCRMARSDLAVYCARLDGPLPPLTLGSFPSLDI
ncbi:hypothetical protein B0H16DRAFT_1594912 [Mycena metata]|uniref:Uncharacterized protein n=1 Tax=Mycena metata TaxID=1033252 RepID=A0AAD7HPB5_9AGAR|nr:hypothetical protein B0H16DRAFT_1594912 [Mycena metata]